MDAFLRIQKTGTASLNKALLQSNISIIGHSYTYPIGPVRGWIWHDEFPTFNPKSFDRIYALIRNPFNILISYYHYTHEGSNKVDGWAYCNEVHNFTSWSQFLDSYLDPTFDWHLPPMKKSMFSFIYDEHGKMVIDHFFKLEEINRLNEFLIKNGGTKLEKKYKRVSCQNESSYDRNKSYYTKEQIKELKYIWKRDLKYFNYDYGEE